MRIKNILLAEDDNDDRSRIGDVFNELGHQVRITGDGLSAFDEVVAKVKEALAA